MFSPGSVKRDPRGPIRTTRLPNGTVVVEDAYEGRVVLAGGVEVEIRGIDTGERGVRRSTTSP